jgi:hypothetical protein
MTYIRSRLINGYGPYDYEVKSVRKGKKVEQVFVQYLGRTSERNVVAKSREPKKGYLEFGEGETTERKMPKTWDRLRRERAQSISRATGASPFQADALAKTAWRMGLDPGRVDWDRLQGRDLSYDEKIEMLGEMSGMSIKTEKETELEQELWLESQAEREAYRESSA